MQASGSRGRAKPKIRPPRMPPTSTATPDSWSHLASAIRQIHAHNASSLSYEETYRHAYNLVIGKHGARVYRGVLELVVENLEKMVKEVVVPAFPVGGGSLGMGGNLGGGPGREEDSVQAAQEGERLLAAVRAVWDDHVGNMLKLGQVLRYMDKFYTAPASLPLIYPAGLTAFTTNILLSPAYPVRAHVVGAVLRLIHIERRGGVVERSKVRGCVDVLRGAAVGEDRHGGGGGEAGGTKGTRAGGNAKHSAMTGTTTVTASGSGAHNDKHDPYVPTFYTLYLEPEILRESEAFYRAEGEQLMHECGVPEYMERVESRLHSERARCSHYLAARTDAPLQRILQRTLLSEHLGGILGPGSSGAAVESGSASGSALNVHAPGMASGSSSRAPHPHPPLSHLITHESIPDLARMYRLLGQVDGGLDVLKGALGEVVRWRGREVNEGVGGEEATIGEDEDPEGEGGSKKVARDIKGKGKAIEPPEGDDEAADIKAETAPDIKGKAKAIATITEDAGSADLKTKTPATTSTARTTTTASALRWVSDVLALKAKFDRVLRDAFGADVRLGGAINEAFESFINGNTRAPEFISLFIDDHLKKGFKGKSDAEIDTILDATITAFRFLAEKDVFERYYKAHLAKRLLARAGGSKGAGGIGAADDDAERGMLARLKVECGFQFTQRMEGMFHDVKLSAEAGEAWRAWVARGDGTAPRVDLSVTIMTSTFWPPFPLSPCTLPPALHASTLAFSAFYLRRHSGRKLTWHMGLGGAEVRARFRGGKVHDLSVSTLGCVVLLLFEEVGEGERMGYEEIRTATNLPDAELKRTLQSLACAKYKVLKKHPPSRDVASTDAFSFNLDFRAPLQKVRISTVAGRVESGAERQETRDRVEEERRHQTEACIVRIMKDRKRMTHTDLITEVTRQLAGRFQPQPAMVKKRVESLIEREYLDRGADRKSYTYLA